MKDGGPAFPRESRYGAEFSCDGMSLRDWLVGMALQGLLSSCEHDGTWENVEMTVNHAFCFADVVLREREK